MLDKWVDDVLIAIKEANKENGIELNKSDCIVANSIIFKLMKSYIWGSHFENAVLKIRNDNSGYSWIDIKSIEDKDSDITLSYESRINCLSHMYKSKGWDDEDSNKWITDNRAESKTYNNPINLEDQNKVVKHLIKKPYYKMLLEEDINKQNIYLSDLSEISIKVHEELNYISLLKDTSMYKYNGNPITEIFGHKYTTHSENRIMVVASNKLGPVGILCLYDYERNTEDRYNQDRLSLSYVSVSPFCRQIGISKKLLDAAFKYASEKNKYITRTSPSVFGKKTTYDSFTKHAKSKYPGIPFIKEEDAQIIQMMYAKNNFLREFNFSERKSIVKECLKSIAIEINKTQNCNENEFSYYIDHDKILEKMKQKIDGMRKSKDENLALVIY